MASRTLLQRLAGHRRPANPVASEPPPRDPDELIEGGREEAVSPLQTLAHSIQKAAADLRQLEDVRVRLEALRGPMAEEFENRVTDNNRLAQLTSELRTTRARLDEAETDLARANAKVAELETRAGSLTHDLGAAQVALASASEQVERLRPLHHDAITQIEEQRAHIIAYSSEVFDLKTDKEYLASQLKTAEAERAAAEAQLAAARESGAEAEARAEGAFKRLEQAAADHMTLERIIREARVAAAGDKDRASELTAQLAAARAEARLAADSADQMLAATRIEIDDLRARLEEALAHARQMQQMHAEVAGGQSALLEERARLQRDLSSAQAENRQTAQRIEVLETLTADWKRRFADVDAARLAAVARAEDMQLNFAQADAALKRCETIAQQREGDLREAHDVHEELQNRLRAEIADLKSGLNQARAELKMMRASLAARS
jgi:chromosome segregation ATPase